jgi:sec-independent protein translocase protein TatA
MVTNILQPTHLIIVMAVALLILGPKRLPEAGRALGQGLKEFKGSISGAEDDPQDQIDSIAGSAPEA